MMNLHIFNSETARKIIHSKFSVPGSQLLAISQWLSTMSQFNVGVYVGGAADAHTPYIASACYSETGELGCLHGPGYDTLTIPSTTDSGQAVKALVVEF